MIGHDIGAGMVGRVLAAWPQLIRHAVAMAVPPPRTGRQQGLQQRNDLGGRIEVRIWDGQLVQEKAGQVVAEHVEVMV
jgi:pimeloyl-ACP methyl ester carboxylesterase